VQLDAGMGQQPFLYCRGLVRGQVVADHVDGQARLGLPVDLIQEVAEVDRAVLRGQLADYRAAAAAIDCLDDRVQISRLLLVLRSKGADLLSSCG
jgi:hypothetical protein